MGTLLNCIKGCYTLKAEGKFPERILNFASTSGIYIQNVRRRDSDTLTFTVSRKGAKKLLECNIEGLEVSIFAKFGIPFFLQKHKKRGLLFTLPIIVAIAVIIFSQFIWRVEITGGDKVLRSQVQKVIEKNGIRFGSLKYKIDQYNIKRKAIMELDDLSWMWVDIRGTTAKVKVQKRTLRPQVNEIHEPSDVIAMHSGIIEKMQTFCGQPLFKEGMTVEKGQVLITGVFKSENENIPVYYHHASGNVILKVYEKKTVVIPKKTLIKTPTGRKKSVFSLNFKKNNIKFSLNSGISYSNYDKIEKKYGLWKFPLSFSKTEYREVKVTSSDTDLSAQLKKRREDFEKELTRKKMKVSVISEYTEEKEDNVSVTFTAECLVRTDKEVPIADIETENVPD